MNKQRLSVIIPVYKGENFLSQLVKELKDLKSLLEQGNYGLIMEEAIFVDDCSVDNSLGVLKSFESEYSWIKLIKMSTNSGQHAATVEGMRISSSDWIVTMDEDLQHRPKDIVHLWGQRNREGADLVYAVPSGSVHKSIIRNQSSKWIKKLISTLSSKKEILYFNSFRLLKKDLAKKTVAQFERNGYLDMLLINHTNKIGAVSLSLIDIRSEGSGYGYFKLFMHSKRFLQSSGINKFLKNWKTTSP